MTHTFAKLDTKVTNGTTLLKRFINTKRGLFNHAYIKGTACSNVKFFFLVDHLVHFFN